MASLTRLPNPQMYTIGWITALDKELTAAQASMISSLPYLRFGLMVGIGAGIPRLADNVDIRLGDVVVS
ncbi:pfs domain-containing protein [Colletotrichum kahawae]|uniref:Pfs domain-containing protein n=1 Tax=Colletotrichum kahawae TaxID=34407 RepID=A0AAE0D7N5_COLKA|nr:pfs domain-containing protein [Colletotrichum kahawae]